MLVVLAAIIFSGAGLARLAVAVWPSRTADAGAPSAPASPSQPRSPSPSASTTSSATSEPRPVAGPDRPLALWVGGDSLADTLGASLATVGGAVVRVTVDGRPSTGLSRPDYFDWHAYLEEVLASGPPDVVVVMLGGNDGQSFEVDGAVYPTASDEWRAEYARRVSAVMDLLEERVRDVYWVGQPPMRSAELAAEMRVVNAIYAEEARGRERLRFVDAAALLGDADGGFVETLPGPDGVPVRVRAPDGVHLTRTGGERLAAAVFDLFAERWDFAGPG